MKKSTTFEFITKATEIHGIRYDYSRVEYLNATTKVIITCRKHGDYFQKPNDHLSGRTGCPACKFEKIGNIKRTPIETVLFEFNSVHGDVYDYSDVDFVNKESKITIICKQHGRFLQAPNKHILGQGCPACKYSSGEQKIIKILKQFDIEFEKEKSFDGLIGDYRKLKFDFYIHKLNAIIEYDGEFHFNYTKIFNYKNITEDEAIEKFLKIKEYDAIKNNYCKFNGIRLLRIPYTMKSHVQIQRKILSFLQIS